MGPCAILWTDPFPYKPGSAFCNVFVLIQLRIIRVVNLTSLFEVKGLTLNQGLFSWDIPVSLINDDNELTNSGGGEMHIHNDPIHNFPFEDPIPV